jgi:hypothetical protein
MSFLQNLFGGGMPCPSDRRAEVNKMFDDLVRIGRKEGFLSEHPGAGFNNQCRNIQARQIGQRLYDIGGVVLMDYIMRKIKHPLGKDLSSHLEYCWAEIGTWLS